MIFNITMRSLVQYVQLRGGPMSHVRQNDKTSWIHEVGARIWTSGGNEIINESSMGKRQQCTAVEIMAMLLQV